MCMALTGKEGQRHNVAGIDGQVGAAPILHSKIETGERRMDLVAFLHIARAIGFDPCTVIMQLVDNS